MSSDGSSPGVFDQLVDELQALVHEGLKGLRSLPFPALRRVTAKIFGTTGEDDLPAEMERALRRAVSRLGEGAAGQAAGLLFGLLPGTRGQRLPDRRRQAAAVYGIQPGSFRKQPQADLIAEVAQELLKLAEEAQVRQTRGELEAGEPGEVRLAINWLERFETYYRIWTPIFGVGSDLTAALSARARQTYAREVEDHADFALYHYACFSRELRLFVVAYGGLWLFASAAAEEAVSEAVHAIWWHTPFTERDDSWLRSTLAGVANQEMDGFLAVLDQSDLGALLRTVWREWIEECGGSEDQATETCHVHQAIRQCSIYTTTIDAEWYRIAGWYRERQSFEDPIAEVNQLHERFP